MRSHRPLPKSASVIAASLAGVFAACGGDQPCQDLNPTAPGCQDTAPVYALALGQDTLTLLPDDTATISATVTEDGRVVSVPVQWMSTNPSVVTVSQTGTVIGVADGTASLLASVTASGVSLQERVDVAVILGAQAEGVVVADEILGLLSDSAEVANGTLRLEKLTSGASVKVGDVLVGSENGGYLKKVSSVTDEGNVLVVKGDDASLAEALEDAIFDIENALTLGTSPLGVSANGARVLTPSSIEAMPGVTVDPSGVVNLDGVQFGITYQSGGGSINVGVKIADGSFSFTPGFNAGAKIKWFRLKKFHASASGAMAFDARVETSISGTVRKGAQQDFLPRKAQRLLTARFPGGCFVVAAVPVCYDISFALNAYVETSATLSGTVTNTFSGNSFLQLGARYDDGRWSPISSSSGGLQSGPMQLSAGGEVGVRFGIAPDIHLRFYQVAGPFIGLDGSVGLTAGLDAFDLFLRAQAQLDLVLGFRVEILDFELASFSTNVRLLTSPAAEVRTPAYQLQLQPSSVSVPVGGQQQMTLRAFFIGGLEVPLPGTPTWTSDQSSVATVSNGGLVRGVSQGSANVTAGYPPSTLSVSAPVTVTASGPAFEITASNMSFQHMVGGTSCPQDVGTFTVMNNTGANGNLSVTSGGAPLDFVMPNGSFGAGSLSATVPAGTTNVGVRFNCSSATSFTRTVMVNASNGQGSASREFTVAGTIEDPDDPAIALSVYELFFTGMAGGTNPAAQAVGVSNAGSGTLTGLTRRIDYRPGDPTGWLTATLGSTTAPTSLNVVATTGALPVGSYDAVIILTASGVEGETALYVTFTVSGGDPPTVTGWTPGGTGVGIETVVTATFSEPIDPATLEGHLVLHSPTGPVPGTVSYDAGSRTATFTPSDPLMEFQTEYSAIADGGIRDLSGDPLVPAERSFTTVLVDPDYFYRITSELLGPSRSLDTYSGGGFECFMGDSDAYTGQWWYFTSTGSPPYLHMRNHFGGDELFLEGADAPGPCFLGGGGNFTGQQWMVVPLGSGLYRFQNLNFGAAKSLDTSLVDGYANPRMEPTADTPAQKWRLMRLHRR